jgi:hypothetical protein
MHGTVHGSMGFSLFFCNGRKERKNTKTQKVKKHVSRTFSGYDLFLLVSHFLSA